MTVKTLYGVWAKPDLNEGLGRENLIYVTESPTQAKDLARGRGVQGSDASVRPVELLVDYHQNLYVPLHDIGIRRHPTKSQIEQDKIIFAEQEHQKKIEEIRVKMREAGFSEDEIEAIK